MAIAIRNVTTNLTTGSATISVVTPGTVQAGDLLVIIHGNDFYAASNMPTPTVSPSATVTAITNGAADAGANHAHTKSYTAVAASSGAQTISVTESGTADEEKCLIVYVLTGANTSTPIDIAGNATGTSAATNVAPSISPSSSNAFLICHTNSGDGAKAASYTPPAGLSEDYDQTLAAGISCTGASVQLGSSGATGTESFTPNVSIPYGALSIAIKTSSGVTMASLPWTSTF